MTEDPVMTIDMDNMHTQHVGTQEALALGLGAIRGVEQTTTGHSY